MQRALAAVLTEVYEEEFHDFSYGFRPGRGCHAALRALARHIGRGRVNWVVEADVQGFFDNVDHAQLLRMVAVRVSDERVLRLLRRMLAAGVLEEGHWLETERGTPQGGVISPLLANIHLHYALDEWFAKVVRRCCAGEAYLVRYADDCAPRKRGRRPQPTESSAAQEMRDGPSDSDGRVRVQATGRGFGPMVEVFTSSAFAGVPSPQDGTSRGTAFS